MNYNELQWTTMNYNELQWTTDLRYMYIYSEIYETL